MQEAWQQHPGPRRAPIMAALSAGRFATAAAYFFGGAVGASLSDTIASLSTTSRAHVPSAGRIRQHLHTLRVLSNRGRHDEEIRERLRRGQSVDERGQPLQTLAAADGDVLLDAMLWVAEAAASHLHGSRWQGRRANARGVPSGEAPDGSGHSHEAGQGYGAKAVLLCVFVLSWAMSSWLSILPVD